MLRTICAALCVMCVAVPAMACDDEDEDSGYMAWVPEGWTVLAVDDEDVNGDGIPDASLLLEADDSSGVRRFVVLIGTERGGYFNEIPLVDVLIPSRERDVDRTYRRV
jgi:hypothetical protein